MNAKRRSSQTAGDERQTGGSVATDGARAATAVQRVLSLIAGGDVAGALALYDKTARTLVNWPPQPDLLAMIKALGAAKADADAIRLMRDHCRYYPDASARIRLKLAQVLIRDRQRPVAALRVLAEIAPGSLPDDLELARRKLVQHAETMCEDGVLELEDDD